MDEASSSSEQPQREPTDNALTGSEQIQTAKWTRYLPEAFGIQKAVESSKYRWCARESALWGIATGSAMTFHRLRMKSSSTMVVNLGFISFFTVFGGSYYFCVKRRDYQEQMIQLMMRLNSFEPAEEMPDPTPLDEKHPFISPGGDATSAVREKQYVANLPERKEWQAQLPTQDADKVFRPTKPQS